MRLNLNWYNNERERERERDNDLNTSVQVVYRDRHKGKVSILCHEILSVVIKLKYMKLHVSARIQKIHHQALRHKRKITLLHLV